MATYRNPWHKTNGGYGPAMYETSAKPVVYGGYEIFERVAGHVWDVVKDGVCITQRAGINGAKQAIDALQAEQVAA